AVGLWALASPRLRPRFAGIERADSWSTDAHKGLNTPYDCGIAITAHPAAHRRAMTLRADYLVDGEEDRHPIDWNPEMSRRARATAVYATIRALGRVGHRRDGRAQRRHGASLRRETRPPRRGRDPQRGGAEPGPRPVPRPRWGRRRP